MAIVPTHRRDIEIEEDMAEEIARVHGYENLEPMLPDSVMPHYRAGSAPLRGCAARRARRARPGRGRHERADRAGRPRAARLRRGRPGHDPGREPVTADHSELRRSLLPGMLEVLARNERQRRPDVAAFEIGAVHEWVDGEPAEADWLGILLAGNARVQSWVEPARAAGVEDAKGLIESVAARFNLGRISYRATEPRAGVEHPGRTAEVLLVDRLGVRWCHRPSRRGRIPRLLNAYEVKAERVVFAQLEMAPLVAAFDPAAEVRDVEALPVIERDLAVIVSRETPGRERRSRDPRQRRAIPDGPRALRPLSGPTAEDQRGEPRVSAAVPADRCPAFRSVNREVGRGGHRRPSRAMSAGGSAVEADVVIVVLLVAGFILGVVRGAVRQLIVLGAWLVAFLVAPYFRPTVGDWILSNAPEYSREYVDMLAFLASFLVAFPARPGDHRDWWPHGEAL